MRTKKGTVLSAKMNKTIVIKVDSYKIHPKYKKRFRVSRKYFAHDESSAAKVGDVVTIYETRPLSKLKRWTLTKPEKVTKVN